MAHIIPGLHKQSLVSMVTLCNAGCKIEVDAIRCVIKYRGKEIIKCRKCTQTGLWLLPLSNDAIEEHDTCENENVEIALSAYHTSSQAELAQYHHQSLWSPPVSTLIKAIKNHHLDTFPGLTTAVLRHLPPSTATAKGHMHRTRANVRSTRTQTNDSQDARLDANDMNPAQEVCSIQESDIFCFAALADTRDGVIYTDLPGPFPVRSIRNNQYIFVCYTYQPNAILVRPMKSRSDECMVAAYTDIYDYLENRGHKPKLNIMDNEASKAVQNYIKRQNVAWQLVEPHNHRVNTAERAIQTFKITLSPD